MAWEQQLEMNNFKIWFVASMRHKIQLSQARTANQADALLRCAVRANVRESGFIKNVWVKRTLQTEVVTLNLFYKLNIQA